MFEFYKIVYDYERKNQKQNKHIQKINGKTQYLNVKATSKQRQNAIGKDITCTKFLLPEVYRREDFSLIRLGNK